MRPLTATLLVALAPLSACGGAPATTTHQAPTPSAPPKPLANVEPSAKPAEPVAEPAASAPPAEKSEGVPTTCAKREGKVCVPPLSFVKRLCGGFFPDVALGMFGKNTPWTRGYLNRNVEAWNASGGAASNDKLVFDEEVLVLAHKAADTGGMQVSGAGDTYDVLRWDGTCASLAQEELTLKPPPKAKFARIPWKNLDEKVKGALQANEKIAKVDAERRKECRGASMGEVSAKCIKADEQLSAAIVEYVRSGGAVPPPEKLP